MIEITDTDLIAAETKLGLSFDDESKEFIKCMTTKDIQACPGAGKTTSLVAKLDILSNHMPFADNSGVLVLTHTNVAVDEIKKKLGVNAKKLLGYPNHVGTFQSFVNKYLAIPMYVKLFGKKPERIDSELFENKLLEKLKKYYLDGFILMSSQANNYSNIEAYLQALEVEESRVVFVQSNGSRKSIVNAGKPSYRNLKRAFDENIIEQLISDGYLTYEHCYELALGYLKEYPQLAQTFRQRFRYVFIDEIQDTDDKQFQIIEKLFENSSVVIQKIGDNNQAIFNYLGDKSEGWQIQENPIEIKNTKRLSKSIADQATKVALNPQELDGNASIQLQPSIILFNDGNIESVIDKFGDLIVENNLHTVPYPVFKAVGGVGKQNDNGHTLLNYHPTYKRKNDDLEHDNLIDKLNCYEKGEITLKLHRDIVLDIINDYLKVTNIKNIDDKYFNKISIFSFLKDLDESRHQEFKLRLLQTATKFYNRECVKIDLQDLIQIILTSFDKEFDEDLFLSVIRKYKTSVEQKMSSNQFRYVSSDITFDIEVSTIHKVKGETHTATLVLETFNNGYDVFQLLELLKGKNKKGLENKKKLIYVAMSRPTHFLCLAMHKKQKKRDINAQDIQALQENGFNIIEL